MARVESGIRADLAEIKKAVDSLVDLLRPGLPLSSQFIALIEEKTKDFVGREYVFDEIEDFLKHEDKGYFIIEAEPGVGKSAILAKYVRNTGCVHHFNIQSGKQKQKPWLRPFTPSLTPPGTPLVRTLTGHSSYVKAVAITPDGQQVVSASFDNTLKVWDLHSGAEQFTLRGHSDSVGAVAITPNGKQVVSASKDNTLKVWDLESGTARFTLTGHSNWVEAVAITPDGKQMVSASWDNTLKVWDLESGAEQFTLTGHSNLVRAVAITPDGQQVVSASWDKTIKVWNLHSGAERLTLTGHSDWIMAVAITPDGKQVVSASIDNTLKVWDLESGTEIASFSGDGALYCCAVAPDGVTIVAGEASGRVHFLRLEGVARRG
jgi:WD40 repeat protein